MRALTFQLTGSLAVAVSVAMLVLPLSGCGTRQDGSGGLPVLSFPRMGGAPEQTEPELPDTEATVDSSQAPAPADSFPTDSFPTDVGFDEP